MSFERSPRVPRSCIVPYADIGRKLPIRLDNATPLLSSYLRKLSFRMANRVPFRFSHFYGMAVYTSECDNFRVRRDPGLGGFLISKNPEVVYEAERLRRGSR